MKPFGKMKNEEIDEFKVENISLERRFQIINEMGFIGFLSELGYREDKMWTDEEQETLDKLCEYTKKHTKNLIEELKVWEKDGKPKEKDDYNQKSKKKILKKKK